MTSLFRIDWPTQKGMPGQFGYPPGQIG